MRVQPHAGAELARPVHIAIGFRVKSGHAIAVALSGSAAKPVPMMRLDVALSDPKVHETRQPYHDGFYHQQEDPKEIARRVRIIERCAKESVTALLASIDGGATPASKARVCAALVVGSVIDPATVGNPHIRAHASEGRLFRTVLADALAAHGVGCDVIVEKELPAKAAAGIGQSNAHIKRAVAGFGDAIGSPWRTDEKSAATAAWLALC
ncbi:MAG TPA: hypothetical protein VGY57_13280 [Vicinamibacterales bacterium]|nr:hypothetical protein [Vicinamibacterales bacterium]